jgi:hypothetical protein
MPMRLVDHLLFIAEHDDHHLARIWELHLNCGPGQNRRVSWGAVFWTPSISVVVGYISLRFEL